MGGCETDGVDRRPALAVGIDTFSVVLFVSIGRREHERESTIVGLIETAAPFLIGLAVAWIALRAWQRPTDWRTGVGVWLITLGLGLATRRLVFDDGIALSFVIVAALFLALFLIGWRVAFGLIERRRLRGRATPSNRAPSSTR